MMSSPIVFTSLLKSSLIPGEFRIILVSGILQDCHLLQFTRWFSEPLSLVHWRNIYLDSRYGASCQQLKLNKM